MPDAVLVLTHLLDENDKPNLESRLRADKAAGIFSAHSLDYMITSGWSFDGKLDRPVSALMKDYIMQAYNIADNCILISPRSRDTVGDAVFCRADIVQPWQIQELHVVTSVYHLNRTQEIFKYVFNGKTSLHFHGVQIDVGSKTHQHELKSLATFQETFKGQSADDAATLIHVMAGKHPFYNGVIYPRIH